MRRNLRILIVSVAALMVVPVIAVASHSFVDVPDSNVFHADIEWMDTTGVTKGCNPPANDRYCPDDEVTRGQMAAFLRRLAEGQIVDAGSLAGRSAAEFPTQAYVLVDEDGTVEADDSFNPAGSISVNRNESSVGFYDVTFFGFDINHAQVTRYGNDSSGDSCSIRDWVGGRTVRVRCFDTSGAGVFSDFAVSVISHG